MINWIGGASCGIEEYLIGVIIFVGDRYSVDILLVKETPPK